MQQHVVSSLNQNQLPFVVNNKDRLTFALKSTEEAVGESTASEEEATDEVSAEAAAPEDDENIMKMYLGSLPTNYGQTEIREMLAPFCADESSIVNISVPTDRMTGLPRGFAFVDMEKEGAAKAIAELSGTEIDGQPIRINEQGERRDGGGKKG